MSEAEAAVLKLLDRRQKSRLDQLQLQLQGTAAFLSENVQERLNMDPAQIELVKQAIIEGRQEIDRYQGVPPEFGKHITAVPDTNKARIDPAIKKEFGDAMERLALKAKDARATIDRKIFKLLSKRQRATYEKMLGEPADLYKLQGIASPKPSDPKQGAATK